MGSMTNMGWLVVAAMMTVGFSGCMDGDSCSAAQGMTQDGQGQEAVCSGRNFSYANQGMVSGTKTYEWTNSADKASVKAAIQGMGVVKVTVKDAAGKTVYSKDHGAMGQSAGSTTSSEGTPGAWTVSLQFSGFQGQVAINISPA